MLITPSSLSPLGELPATFFSMETGKAPCNLFVVVRRRALDSQDSRSLAWAHDSKSRASNPVRPIRPVRTFVHPGNCGNCRQLRSFQRLRSKKSGEPAMPNSPARFVEFTPSIVHTSWLGRCQRPTLPNPPFSLAHELLTRMPSRPAPALCRLTHSISGQVSFSDIRPEDHPWPATGSPAAWHHS